MVRRIASSVPILFNPAAVAAACNSAALRKDASLCSSVFRRSPLSSLVRAVSLLISTLSNVAADALSTLSIVVKESIVFSRTGRSSVIVLVWLTSAPSTVAGIIIFLCRSLSGRLVFRHWEAASSSIVMATTCRHQAKCVRNKFYMSCAD